MKTPDDKLRAAVRKELQRNHLLSEAAVEHHLEMCVSLIKSNATKEYYKSLQPVVDIKALENEWYGLLATHQIALEPSFAELIFNHFKPNLQPPVPESKLIDDILIYLKADFDHPLEHQRNESVKLYDKLIEYKQSKTNSDENI